MKFYSETVPDPAPRTPKDKVIPKNQEPAESAGSPFLPTGPYCDGCEPTTHAFPEGSWSARQLDRFSVNCSTENAVYTLTAKME